MAPVKGGMKVFVTRHARRRYRERCPDGPGLLAEYQEARRPTKRQWQTLMGRHRLRPFIRDDRYGQEWTQHALISKQKTVIIVKTNDAGDVHIVTCYPLFQCRSLPKCA